MFSSAPFEGNIGPGDCVVGSPDSLIGVVEGPRHVHAETASVFVVVDGEHVGLVNRIVLEGVEGCHLRNYVVVLLGGKQNGVLSDCMEQFYDEHCQAHAQNEQGGDPPAFVVELFALLHLKEPRFGEQV